MNDGSTHLGAVFRCTARQLPASFENAETLALGFWTPDASPRPLGHTDEALLIRFG